MNLGDYQKKSKETAIYPVIGHGVVYPTLGLAGESAEIANKVKKIFRDDDGKISDDKKSAISKELGDVLWYVAQVANELDLDLDVIAENNLDRLESRKNRGKLSGDGDNR
jgi:NTP pyrophosphatase (non-canonical NTP hydrolase)